MKSPWIRRLVATLWCLAFLATNAPAAMLKQTIIPPEADDYSVVSMVRLARTGEAEALAEKAGQQRVHNTDFNKISPTHARLGDLVEIYVKNLDLWLVDLERKRPQIPGTTLPAWDTEQSLRDLIDARLPQIRLVLNGHLLSTILVVAPSYRDLSRDATATESSRKNPPGKPHDFYDCLRFRLIRESSIPASREDWAEILKESRGDSRMDVTIALVGSEGNADVMPSWVQRGQMEPSREFLMQRLPWDGWLVGGAILLGAALFVFIVLAKRTTLVREPSQQKCPNGLPPYSLGRCQMAFWFFFAAAAFFFLWLVTGRGDLDTLNASTLGLIGISAATGLGAAALSAKEAAALPPQAPQPITPGERVVEAKKQIRIKQAELGNKPDAPRQQQLHEEITMLEGQIRIDQATIDGWKRTRPFRFLNDLITDDNTGDVVSFNRFQIVVWTLVLGVVFVSDVWTRLAMPEFNSTLLILMGLSSGTYLAGKVGK